MSDDWKQRAEEWLNSRDTGISSESIFHYMALGLKTGDAPSDPADVGRCLRLLARFPEWKPRMDEMAQVSTRWKRIVPQWAAIETSFIEEAGGKLPERWASWSAPKTYELMKIALGEREKSHA